MRAPSSEQLSSFSSLLVADHQAAEALSSKHARLFTARHVLYWVARTALTLLVYLSLQALGLVAQLLETFPGAPPLAVVLTLMVVVVAAIDLCFQPTRRRLRQETWARGLAVPLSRKGQGELSRLTAALGGRQSPEQDPRDARVVHLLLARNRTAWTRSVLFRNSDASRAQQ